MDNKDKDFYNKDEGPDTPDGGSAGRFRGVKRRELQNESAFTSDRNGQRLKNMPKIVTKDSEALPDYSKPTGALTPAGVDYSSVSHSIDSSVFSEGEVFEDEKFEEEFKDSTRSKTIDVGMLSKDRMSRSRQRSKSLSVDFSKTERFYTSYEQGLSADQVHMRQAEGFVNVTGKKSGKSYSSIFLTNIFTFLNILTFTVGAALIAVNAKGSQLFFLVIIIANILIGIIQEIKAKRTVDKLKLMTAPTAIVVRDGVKSAIPITEVVLDDVVFLETGKQICSDSIVIRGEMEVNESMLTGESDAMKKSVGSELFSGSFVTSGNCYARVNKVGAANYVETLSSYAKRYRKPKSELNSSIRLIIKIVSIFILPITAIMLWNNARNGLAIDANIMAVSGAVIGMIPAGMYLLTSTALVVSVVKLAKRKAVVQDLYCIEMLARVDVLCLDKTGTITDGTMQVNKIIEIKGAEMQYPLKDIIGSILSATEDNNQTARALANKFGYSQALKAIEVLPFSSQRKLSAVSFEGAGTYMFGAPEFVLKDVGIRIQKVINENAANGFRVLCLAHSPSDIAGGKLPAVRRPICLIVIEDHIREDAAETIKWFRENNVAVKVISGDNPITVSEVARRVGVENAELYISLDGMSNQEVTEAAGKYTVFGRVSPEQKLLIVKALKNKGRTVAMTGDGVNDILAMREADCSVSIASGSEAARNVSHLVLMDSSFTSMPDVVREGRQVVNNIQKSSSLFLMKTFMSIVLSMIFLLVPVIPGTVFKEYPYTTDMLLLLEFFIIALSSFVLALQSNHSIIKGKFLSNVLSRCIPSGLTLVIATMSVYFYCTKMGSSVELYKTMLVITLSLTGVMLLAKICEPFDAVRTVLVIIVGGLTVASIFFIPESIIGIYRDSMVMIDWLFVICITLGAYFLASILLKAMKAMNFMH